MFIKKLYNNQREIAIAILAVFSFVFICSFLCDQDLNYKTLLHQDNHHNDGGITSDNHTHFHGNETSSYMGESHHKEDASAEDCCEEETSRFFASLVKHEIKKFELDEVVLSLELLRIVTIKKFHPLEKINPNYRFSEALSPPVTGQYARILFQSFLC